MILPQREGPDFRFADPISVDRGGAGYSIQVMGGAGHSWNPGRTLLLRVTPDMNHY